MSTMQVFRRLQLPNTLVKGGLYLVRNAETGFLEITVVGEDGIATKALSYGDVLNMVGSSSGGSSLIIVNTFEELPGQPNATPASGEPKQGVLYLVKLGEDGNNDETLYRWTGEEYIEVSSCPERPRLEVFETYEEIVTESYEIGTLFWVNEPGNNLPENILYILAPGNDLVPLNAPSPGSSFFVVDSFSKLYGEENAPPDIAVPEEKDLYLVAEYLGDGMFNHTFYRHTPQVGWVNLIDLPKCHPLIFVEAFTDLPSFGHPNNLYLVEESTSYLPANILYKWNGEGYDPLNQPCMTLMADW